MALFGQRPDVMDAPWGVRRPMGLFRNQQMESPSGQPPPGAPGPANPLRPDFEGGGSPPIPTATPAVSPNPVAPVGPPSSIYSYQGPTMTLNPNQNAVNSVSGSQPSPFGGSPLAMAQFGFGGGGGGQPGGGSGRERMLWRL